MKVIKKGLFALSFLFVGMIVGVSCSDDSNKEETSVQEISGITEQEIIEVVDSGRVTWHDHFEKMIREAQSSNAEEDDGMLTFAQEQLEKVDSIDNANLESLGANGADGADGKNRLIGYKWVTIRYQSVDCNNNPVTLSELVVFPYNNIFANPHPDNLVIGCHVTITSNKERPTNYYENSLMSDVGMLALHASSNMAGADHENLVVIPDYQGYGASASDVHPYLYQKLTARQVVDGANAGIKWFTSNEKSMENDWKSISVGYSQGGSVAMAVHRYIEENNLSDQLRFRGSVCGDGPYDPVATLKEYIKGGRLYMPVAAALIIKGVCDVNPYVAGKFTASDYFTDGFISTGILDKIASKNYSTGEIQESLVNFSGEGKNFTMMRKTEDGEYKPYTASTKNLYSWVSCSKSEACYAEVSQVMRPEAIEYFTNGSTSSEYSEKMKAIENALEMNNLTLSWQPQHPMVVFHSTKDEVVPFVNYEKASARFYNSNFKGMQYESKTYTHIGTGSSFFAIYEGPLTRKLLNNSWQSWAHDNDIYTLAGLW